MKSSLLSVSWSQHSINSIASPFKYSGVKDNSIVSFQIGLRDFLMTLLFFVVVPTLKITYGSEKPF
jgi:hypothetical protein